jgi:glucose/arabinose dehydrogenase
MKRILAVALLLLAACGGSDEKPIADQSTAATTTAPAPPPPPNPQQARELIANSAELGEYEFTNAGFTTPTSGATMSEPVRQSVRELAAAGWLTLDPAGDVALSEKSRNDKRFLLRPNGLLDIVPLAKKEMGDVTAVRANADGTATVEFTWRWVANEVGAAFKTGLVHDRFAAQQDGRATLMWDGTSWTILQIE